MTDLSKYQTNVGFITDANGTFQKIGYGTNTEAAIRGLEAAEVVITAAQMLAAHTTGIEVIAAPGAGKAIVPKVVEFFLDYNSAAYAAIATGDDIYLRYTDVSGNIVGTVETTGFLDQTSDQRRILVNAGTFTPTANAALVFALGGAITTGDSPLTVKVHEYDIVTLA